MHPTQNFPAGGHSHLPYTVDDHAELIRRLLEPAMAERTEVVPLADALHRITAGRVLSPVDLPLFRNSQMDGFAVVAADLAAIPVTLPVVGEVAARAGSPAPLLAGTAVRIMTGAVVPDGADTVVPVETTTTTAAHVSGGLENVTILRGRTRGDFVRDRGSDAHAGEELLPAARRLAPRHLAVLAAAGLATVEVRARVRVAVITTGAELIAPGEPAGLGQVYDANGVALAAAVRECGAELAFTTRVVDNPDAFLAALKAAVGVADLVLTSGGISMGDYEVVREVLEPLGAVVTHVAMQPGGPQATAVFEGVTVISFPGNPVSTQISFAVFVAPLLRAAAGLPPAAHRPLRLTTAVSSVPDKRQFLRGRTLSADRGAVEPGLVTPVSGPGSHLVAGLAASDVLIDIPADITELSEGDTVETWQL